MAAARTHLASGHDVVVPQLLARPEFIEQLDSKPNMLRRFSERGDHPHGNASEQSLSALHDQLMALLPSRPDARIVPVEDGRPDVTYRVVLSNLR